MNKFVWSLLTVLCLVLAWAVESLILVWAAGFFLLTIIAARLLVAFPPKVEATRVVSANYAHPGDKVRVWVRLRLKKRPFTWLTLNDAAPPLPSEGTQGFLLGPGSRKECEFSYTLSATRRGYFSLGPLQLSYSDPLGFFEQRRILLEADGLTVFPSIKELQSRHLPHIQSSGELLTLRRAYEDASRPAGIRDYRQGDSLRRIHWRATAHVGRMQSKIYDVSTALNALLILNLHRPDYPAGPAETGVTSELGFSLTASLALHLLSAGQKVGLITNGFDPAQAYDPQAVSTEKYIQLAAGRGPDQSLAILSLLGRLQLAQHQSLASTIGELRATLSWGEGLFIITPSVDTETIRELTALEHTGFSIFTLVPGDSPIAARTQTQLFAAGLPAERIILEDDIAGVFA